MKKKYFIILYFILFLHGFIFCQTYEIISQNLKYIPNHSGWPQDHYYIVSHQPVNGQENPTNNTFNVKIYGLDNIQNINIRLKPITKYFNYSNFLFVENNITVNQGIAVSSTYNASDLSDGIYELQIFQNNRWNTVEKGAKYFIIEKIINVNPIITPSVPTYHFEIHYAEQFFFNKANGNIDILRMDSLLNQVESALKNTWQKEVDDWELCQGIAYGVNNSLKNVPIDADKIFHIYINPGMDIRESFYYHKWDKDYFFAWGEDFYQEINIPIRPIKSLDEEDDIKYTKQDEALETVISHEFLHGIQKSYVPLFPGVKLTNPTMLTTA